jgi:hypothetical protein
MEALYVILVIIIAGYLAVEVAMAGGIPDSISDSFYLFERQKKGLGYLFTLWAWTVALMFMILGFEYGNGVFHKNLFVFLSGAGLALTGAAPLFKEQHYRKVHFAGAIVAIVFSTLFALTSPVWIIPVILLPTTVFIPAVSRRISYIYYTEVITLITICVTLNAIR